MRWAIPQLGGFSINREGVDRTALEFCDQCAGYGGTTFSDFS